VAGGIAGTAISLLVLLVLSKKTFPRVSPLQSGFGSVEAIGELLFTDYLVPFEVASFLLMVAIVGAVAVARGKQPDPQAETTAERDREPAALPAGSEILASRGRGDVRKAALIDRGAP
jgi:NADH-quinone oxidoreductase subunit J